MATKNKLYKHHKNKAVLVIRNFSIAAASLFGFIALAAIPTYINSGVDSKIQAKDDSQVAKSDVNVSEEETEELLSINME